MAEQCAQLINQYLIATQDSRDSLPPSTNALIQQLVTIIEQEPQKNLLLVVQASSSAITSESDPMRASANGLLAVLMGPLVESKILSKNQIHFLVEFFIQKLSDGSSIAIEAVNGIKFLSRSAHFQRQQAIDCCNALFQNITPSDFEQPRRLIILMLIDNLMAYHRDALKSMGTIFITGYCSLVEGEKDPRNLIVAFRLAKVILTEFDLGDQVESLFDITFCYFPITFRPPPGNPDAYGGITAEELIQGLIACLAATPHFGIFVLPLLLEKFQAPGFGPKAQVLETVIQAFPTYGQATVAEFRSLFWECFLVEIFQPNTSPSKDFLGLLERACQTLFKVLFPLDVSFSPSGPVEFMKQALEVVMKELHSPEKSRAIPATRLICWIIESGASTTDVILPTITTSMDMLLQLWAATRSAKEDEKLKKQTSILGHLGTIFSSIAAVTGTQVSGKTAFTSATWLTTTIRHEVLSMILTEVTGKEQCADSQVQVAALWTLVRLIGIPNTLDLQEARNVLGTVTQLLVAGHNDEIINASIECLSILADCHPECVASVTIPELLGKLPTTVAHSSTQVASSSIKYLHILECLAALCHRETLVDAFLVQLLDVFAAYCHAAFQESINELIHEDIRSNALDHHAYGHHLLLCLYSSIQLQGELSKDDSKKLATDLGQPSMMITQSRFIIGRLLEILLYEDYSLDLVPIVDRVNRNITAKLGQSVDANLVRNYCSIRNDVQLVIIVGRIVNLLVRRLDFEQQQELATELHAAYHLGSMDELITRLQKKSSLCQTSPTKRTEKGFVPLDIDSTDADKNMMILYSEALIAIRAGIQVPGETLSTTDFIAFKYYRYVCGTASPNLVAFQAGLRYLCSTVNRRAEEFTDFFDDELNQFWESEIAFNRPGSTRSRKFAVEILIWITKGLIVRSDNRGYQLLDRICGLLAEPSELGWWVAKRLSVLVDPRDETLSAKNFAIIKFLWKQRVCQYLVSHLIQGCMESNIDTRSVYLVGLASSLARVSSSLVSLQHEKTMSLLLEAMKLDDLDVKLDSLSTLHDFITHNGPSLATERNLSTMVSVLLLNCTPGNIAVGTDQGEVNTLNSLASAPIVTSSAIQLLALKVLSILPSQVGVGSSSNFQNSEVADQRKNLSKPVLYGERSRVLKALKIVLDDPKREVRMMAVDCRACWFSLSVN